MRSQKLTYTSTIESITFGLSGDEEILRDAVAQIESKNIYDSNRIPRIDGPNSLKLGTTQYSAYNCLTCLNDKQLCLGHPGFINLQYPVYNVLALNEIRKWIKVICFNCGKIVLPISTYENIAISKRLNELSKKMSTGENSKKCDHCKAPKMFIIKSDASKMLFRGAIRENKVNGDIVTIYPHMLFEIFRRVSDETVLELSKTLNNHPRKYILTKIMVIPTCSRPDTVQPSGKMDSNGLTTLYKSIINDGAALSKIPKEINDKLEAQIVKFLKHYYNLMRGSNSNEIEIKSLATILKGKNGLLRRNLLSKRSRQLGRSTIVGDSTLQLNQVGIPLEFAKILQIEETVQPYNKAKLNILLRNGIEKYPGCTRVIKKNGMSLIANYANIYLEDGDVLVRDLLNDDVVEINRQPSLTSSSITALRLLIDMKNNKTIRFNPILCPFFNADFDGDQMNIIVNKKIYSISEISELSSAKNWLIAHTNSVPMIGLVDDSIIGTFELTCDGVTLDRYHAMCLFQNTDIIQKLDKKIYTGRDIVTVMLEKTPLNFSSGTNYYVENLEKWIHYNPKDIKTVIEHGVYKSGVLDKKAISSKVENGLFHNIANIYGPEKTLNLMFHMQQVATNYLTHCGTTMGVSDTLLKPEYREESNALIGDLFNKSRLVADKLNRGEIIAPIHQTVEDFYEQQQIQILQVFDLFDECILKSINFANNNLYRMVSSGTKGKMDHMYNIMSSNGLKTINGKRVEENFGYKRSLVYFRRYETAPESRGYVVNSYSDGLNTVGLIFGAMSARFDIFVKSFSTADTGEQNRKSNKSLESCVTSNMKYAVKSNSIVQLVYGEDYLDTRQTIRVDFPTAFMSDAIFEELHHTGTPQTVFDAEFVRLKQDREKYRRIYSAFEFYKSNYSVPSAKLLAIDPLKTLIHNAGKTAPNEKLLVAMVEKVAAFLEYLPYVYSNDIQYAQKMQLPQYMYDAIWLLSMACAYAFCAKNLIKYNIDEIGLDTALNTIKIKQLTSLVAAGATVGIIAGQSFSEPLTQYMLDAHRRSMSGGTSKSKMTKIKELLSAKPVEKLVNATMNVDVVKELCHDKTAVQKIAAELELLKLSEFVKTYQIFYESYGNPVHSAYKHEAEFIKKFNELNPLISPPKDLTKWCIRFTINKFALVLRNMSLPSIIQSLYHKLYYIVYSPESATEIVIRVYLRSKEYKEKQVRLALKDLLNTTVRGYSGIKSAQAVAVSRSVPDATGKLVKEELYNILIEGTNLERVSTHPKIDSLHVVTSAVQEIAQYLGIEAARQKIIFELKDGVEECSFKHLSLYADLMTSTGYVTGIEKKGVSLREPKNTLLQMGFSFPYQVLEKAVPANNTNIIDGVSAKLLVGDIPRYGTLYNKFTIDEDMLKKNIKTAESYIENL